MSIFAIVSAVCGFFRTPLGKWLAVALAVLAAVWAIWAAGDHHGRASEKAAQARAERAAEAKIVKTDRAIAAIVAPIRQQADAERVRIVTRTQFLKQEVPRYVTLEADRRCIVPAGFVRLYDAAASGEGPPVPGAAGGPDDADSGLAVSDVARTDVDNLGAARQAIAEVTAWREWYPKVRAEYEKLVKPAPDLPPAAPP